MVVIICKFHFLRTKENKREKRGKGFFFFLKAMKRILRSYDSLGRRRLHCQRWRRQCHGFCSLCRIGGFGVRIGCLDIQGICNCKKPIDRIRCTVRCSPVIWTRWVLDGWRLCHEASALNTLLKDIMNYYYYNYYLKKLWYSHPP